MSYCVVCGFFVLRLVCLLLPVSPDCPFLFIAPSIFSNVYFIILFMAIFVRKIGLYRFVNCLVTGIQHHVKPIFILMLS